jgi:hypothetical protein
VESLNKSVSHSSGDMGGGPSLMYAADAMLAYEQFSALNNPA